MKQKQIDKKVGIIKAAEIEFFDKGFNKTTIDEIAIKASCSKSTLYTYFDSKEDLYLSIVYRAFQALLDQHYKNNKFTQDQNGFIRVCHIMFGYIKFSEEQHNYYEALLEYLNFIRERMHNKESKLYATLNRSEYFHRIRDIHNIPLELCVKEIKLGQEDGSVLNLQNPRQIFLTIWALIIGYSKLRSLAGSGSTLYQIEFSDWKEKLHELIKDILLKNDPN